VQNDIGNQYSPMTIVVPIEGAEHIRQLYPVNVAVPKGEGGLLKDSVALCNQIRCVDEARFGKAWPSFPCYDVEGGSSTQNQPES
jgi:mRNA interferase MazF